MKLQELHESEEEKSVLSVMGKQEKHFAGNFSCVDNNLTSLQGAPSSVGGNFSCVNNKLTSLKGAPSSVGANFSCNNNELASLEGAPSSVGRNFYCEHNKLTSLKGAPSSVDRNFYCEYNELTSLEGAPSSVDGNFYCENNKLTSLRGIHKQIKRINGGADFSLNPITSNVLGLLRISGLAKVFLDNKKVENIINKHLKRDRDIFACQEELIDAGFEEYAKL